MPTYTARSPEDLLAAVPVVLGFHPAESVVLLTFGGHVPFHARLGLPPPGASLDETAEMVGVLVEPTARHGVRHVILVVYAAVLTAASEVVAALERAFATAGIDVLEVLGVSGGRWFRLGGGEKSVGVPYDVSTHPFLLESVLDGVVTHGSREQLAASLAVDEEAAARVRALVGRPLSAGEVVAAVGAHLDDGTLPDDEQAAGLLMSLAAPSVRAAVWRLARREAAAEHSLLWSDLVRRAPPELAAWPTALLCLTAWLAGHGALAWCAVDRLTELDPDHPIGPAVSRLLSAAVPPSAAPDLPDLLARVLSIDLRCDSW